MLAQPLSRSDRAAEEGFLQVWTRVSMSEVLRVRWTRTMMFMWGGGCQERERLRGTADAVMDPGAQPPSRSRLPRMAHAFQVPVLACNHHVRGLALSWGPLLAALMQPQ